MVLHLGCGIKKNACSWGWGDAGQVLETYTKRSWERKKHGATEYRKRKKATGLITKQTNKREHGTTECSKGKTVAEHIEHHQG